MGLDFNELLKIQRMMQERAQMEDADDRMVELIAEINKFLSNGRPVQVEELYIFGESKGFSSSAVTSVIEKLLKDGILFKPQDGYIQKEI